MIRKFVGTTLKKSAKEERGNALLLVVIFLAVGGIIITTLLHFTSTALKSSLAAKNNLSQLYAAEIGVNDALWKLNNESIGDIANYSLNNVNGNTVIVTLQRIPIPDLPLYPTYKVTSTALPNETSELKTIITTYISKVPDLFKNAVSGLGDINIKPNVTINGPQAPHINPSKWPTLIQLQEFYQKYYPPYPWSPNPTPNGSTIDAKDYQVNNIPKWYSNAGLTITNTGAAGLTAKLNDVVYISGATGLIVGKTNQEMILDLNGKTIFYDGPGDSEFGTKVTIKGSGCIVTRGNLTFKPNMSTAPDEFVFVMSIEGWVWYQPTKNNPGDYNFYGAVAGGDPATSIDLFSGNELTITQPRIPLIFPLNDAWSTWTPLTWEITRKPISDFIVNIGLPNGEVDTAYTTTLIASGGSSPYTWSVTGGTLPAGLTLNSGTGIISGTPTTLGLSSFTIKVTDNKGLTSEKDFSIFVKPACVITTTSLPDGQLGIAYSGATTLQASGGTTPYSWSIVSGSLPPGLSVYSITGHINGTPLTLGSYSFTVKVTDSIGGTDTKPLSITVVNPLVITTNSPLPSGNRNVYYNTTLTASGGTVAYTWSIESGTLPAGLSLNSNTGVISGTPTTKQTYSFTIRIMDSHGITITKAFTLQINY